MFLVCIFHVAAIYIWYLGMTMRVPGVGLFLFGTESNIDV